MRLSFTLPLLLLAACQTPTEAVRRDGNQIRIESEEREAYAAVQEIARSTCQESGFQTAQLRQRFTERNPARWLPYRVSIFDCR